MIGWKAGGLLMIGAAFAAAPAAAQIVSATAPATAQPIAQVAPIGHVLDADRTRAIDCMATAIAYEAGYEPVEGQQAVAEVILNRARAGSFQKTICGVVFAGSERRTGCQFSFTCDGSLRRRLPNRVMLAARLVAEAAIDGRNPARVSGAAWYHADYVSPYWAPSLVRIAKIGAHIFYRAPGLGDRPSAGGFIPTGEPSIGAIVRSADVSAGTLRSPAPPQAPFAPWGLAPAPSR